MTYRDFERRLAIAELLDRPDPPELRQRGHRRRFDGKLERFRLVPIVGAVFVQGKLLELDVRRPPSSERCNIQWGSVHSMPGKEVEPAA